MLRAVQRVLLRALLGEDPAAELRRQLHEAGDLTPEERAALEHIDADGLRLTHLLVKKLRFERLMGAVPELAELFARDPQEFLRRFDVYTSAVAPEGYLPDQEAELYRRWRASRLPEPPTCP
jgi:hypothetical protein